MEYIKDIDSIVDDLENQILELIDMRGKNESLTLVKDKINNILVLMNKLSLYPHTQKYYYNFTSDKLNIKGDIIGRDKIVININDYSSKKEEQISIKSYLQFIKNISNQLDLSGIGNYFTDPSKSPIKLSDVNIILDIQDKIAHGIDQFGNEYRLSLLSLSGTNIRIIGEWEIIPMKLLEFIDQNKKTALVGELGSGRTTTINQVFFLISNSLLNKSFDNPDLIWLPNIRYNLPLPININLLNFTQSSQFGSTARNLLGFISDNLSPFGDVYKPILLAIRSGNAIFAFENLDIIDEKASIHVIKAIKDLCLIFPDNYYLISCRRIDFNKFNNELHFMKADIVPLSKIQIDDYIHNWHQAARSREWKIAIDSEQKLSKAIHSSELFTIARNPSILAQIVILYNSLLRLPENILDIYSDLVKLLLIKWENPLSNERSLSAALNIPNLNFKIIESAVYELAFKSFCDLEFKNIPKLLVLDSLQKHLGGNWGHAQIICEYIESKNGVIIKQEGDYFTFLTPRIHEYLVSKYFSFQNNLSEVITDLVLTAPMKWKNVLLLTVRLVGTERGISIINSLCYEKYSKTYLDACKTNKNWLEVILLACRALCEVDYFEIKARPERLNIYNNITSWLDIIVMDDDTYTIDHRAEAAHIISKLNYEQIGITTYRPLFTKILSSQLFINSFSSNEDQEIKYEIKYDYWISIYPITQAQYSYFIDENSEYHLPEGNEDYNWSNITRKPNSNLLNHPIVLVSWYDCINYCKWLNNKLKDEIEIPEGYEVRLPTVPEWEMAFKGGVVLNNNEINSNPRRLFPWGNEESNSYANVSNQSTSVVGTTFVGLFKKGCSPYGVYDMLGNAMEWTNTSWGGFDSENSGFPDFYDANDGRENTNTKGLRILKGGSWLFLENLAKCSCRLNPDFKFADVGMRIVIGPKLIQ